MYHTQFNAALVNMTPAKVPLSSHEDRKHLQHSNYFQLSITKQQPGGISCKWLCSAAKNGRNPKDNALSCNKGLPRPLQCGHFFRHVMCKFFTFKRSTTQRHHFICILIKPVFTYSFGLSYNSAAKKQMNRMTE